MARRQQKNRKPIGVHSRLTAIAALDGRTRVAKRLREITSDLTAFAANGSGQISIGQSYLVRRLAIDLHRLEVLDAKMATGTITEADGRVGHALRNSVRLGLRDLNRKEFRAAAPPQRKADDDDLERLLRMA